MCSMPYLIKQIMLEVYASAFFSTSVRDEEIKVIYVVSCNLKQMQCFAETQLQKVRNRI